MPLSEDEQRIINEIERSFYENDPEFAREVSSRTLTRHATRSCQLSGLAFVAGLLLLLVSFAEMFWLGALGFLVMLASAFVFVSSMRKLSRVGWQQVTQSMRDRGLGEAVAERRRRLRERFNRDDR